MILVISALLLVALLALALAGCDGDSTENLAGPAATGTVSWKGNGSENNCETGGKLHWILTPGGNVTLSDGTLTVNFADGSSAQVTGYFPGGGSGAMHFDTVGNSKVVSASASFSYTGNPGNQVLTISHSDCNEPTTTTAAPTTTTVQETTTTVGETTTTAGPTTTVGGVTTTVGGVTTTIGVTTTAGPTTTVGVTTTAGVTTTVGGVTTTAAPTTTTAAPTTTTTAAPTTTTAAPTTTSPSVTGGVTTAPTSGPSTTSGSGGSTPIPDRIDTGGGGTAGTNVTAWVLVAFMGTLALGLGGSAVKLRARARAHRDR